MFINATRQWLKTSPSPTAKWLFRNLKAIVQFNMPAPKLLASPLYHAVVFARNLIASTTRVLFWTPLFKGRLEKGGKRLYLYGGLPFISGPVRIILGDDCRVSGQITVSGRTVSSEYPVLNIGSNVDIGWMTTVAAGRNITIGNNVRIAGRALLAGYPGHPLDAADRAKGLPDNDDQVDDITLEDDVWLATGVSVMAGVTIGKGTVVAAGSVVTKSLPPFVLAGGAPAKVIRPLDDGSSSQPSKEDLL